MTSRKRKAAVLATVSLLAERFPAAFFVLEGRRMPLKIGIAADICEAVPDINKEHLQWALARYCMSPGYLRSLTGGAVRVGLAGDATGTVTDEAAAKAVAMLAQVVSARRKRTAKIVEPPQPVKVVLRDGKSREAKPMVGVVSAAKSTALRMSIEAIREAAQRRRAGWQATSPSTVPGQPPRKSVGSFS
jgi:sRNA-binding protein